MKRFLILFCWSGLKAIFHCSAKPFSRYLFSIFAVRSGSQTAENKEVSSANNLKFDFRLVAKSFMYIRKKEALKCYPSVTPAPIDLEAAVQRCSVKNVFLEISQSSQENTWARVSYLIKLQASGLRLY